MGPSRSLKEGCAVFGGRHTDARAKIAAEMGAVRKAGAETDHRDRHVIVPKKPAGLLDSDQAHELRETEPGFLQLALKRAGGKADLARQLGNLPQARRVLRHQRRAALNRRLETGVAAIGHGRGDAGFGRLDLVLGADRK